MADVGSAGNTKHLAGPAWDSTQPPAQWHTRKVHPGNENAHLMRNIAHSGLWPEFAQYCAYNARAKINAHLMRIAMRIERA
jgi:hypothetical protein